MAYEKHTWECGETVTAELLNHLEDGVAEGGGSASGMESITYSELLAKKNNGTFSPGTQYRITDYICTTTQENSRVVSNPFDIIVVADNENTLNENARACLHDGDTYYSASDHQANLEAWELKYCIDNDGDRFAWADTTNGKGVIYYMKDDRGNECPYDFKQIQFKRYKITECSVASMVGKYTALNHGAAITAVNEENPVWCYTFSVYDKEVEEVVFEDASIMPFRGDNGCSIYGNTMSETYYGDSAIRILNDIVFINTFGNNCESNTFGNNCESNTFGGNCYSNTFENSGKSNTFGDNCVFNTFGYGCQSNTLGDSCSSNTFGDSCSSNAVGDGCAFNTFGGNCYSNTFGGNCYSNTFGDSCNSNAFGNSCQSNTFGDSCNSNAIGDRCQYIDFFKNATTQNNCCYSILSGTAGTYSSHLAINGTNNNNFVTYVGMNSSGALKTWVPADLVQ